GTSLRSAGESRRMPSVFLKLRKDASTFSRRAIGPRPGAHNASEAIGAWRALAPSPLGLGLNGIIVHWKYFVQLQRPVLPSRCVARLDQRHRLQVVFAADLRLAAFFQRAQELRHRAGEGVREPDFLPPRLNPFSTAVDRRVVERAGGGVRVFGPADRAAG